MAHRRLPPRGLIAIPAMNCAPFVGGAIADALRAFPEAEWAIAVFINPSTDGTLAAARAAADLAPERVRVFDNEINLGLGGSFQKAFEYARAEECRFFGFFHGDHQAEARDLRAILETLETEPLDAVLGSRFGSGARRRGYGHRRLIANVGLNLLASLLTARRISELGSGCVGFRVDAFAPESLRSFGKAITFDLLILLWFIERGRPFIFKPIRWNDFGQTTTVRDFAVGWDVLRILVRWRLFGIGALLNNSASIRDLTSSSVKSNPLKLNGNKINPQVITQCVDKESELLTKV